MTSTYKRFSRFLGDQLTAIARFLIAASIVVYLASLFIEPLQDWLVDSGAINVLILVLVAEILNQANPRPIVSVGETQEGVLPALKEYVNTANPRKADLLEYSSWSVGSLLECLDSRGARVRLLMCHPDAALDEHQEHSIRVSLDRLPKNFANPDRLEIRLYRTTASLRGRKVVGDWDGRVNLGWYTYLNHEQAPHLRGHNNAMVLASTSTEEGRALEAMFDRVFEALWNDATTVRSSEYSAGQGAAEASR